jgi:tetratricopeptide (TPR) repeat protein
VIRRFFVCLMVFSALSAWAGNAPWVQVHSQNFTVITDAGEKRGRDVAIHFEQMRAVFGTLFAKAKITSTQPLYILAFRNTKEFRNVCPLWQGKPEELAGFFQAGNGVTYIAVDLSTEDKWSVVFHEYGHFLLNGNVKSAPPWFDEGFAEYFSTVKMQGKNFLFGNIPESAPYVLSQNKWLPLAQLFSVTHDSNVYNERNHATVFYAEAWLAMAHFWFYKGDQQKVNKLLDLMEQNVPAEEAIRQGFGVEPKVLDKEFRDFYSSGRVGLYQAPMPPGIDDMQMTVTPVDEVDARARVAELKLQMRDRRAEGVQDFEAILKERPDHPVALRGLAYAALQSGEKDKAADLFRRAAATKSDDPHIYFFSAVLLQQMGAQSKPELLKEMQSNLQRAIELDQTFADAYGWLGLSYAWAGDMKQAIPSTQKAVELSPRNEQWAMNLAGYYANDNRLDDALAVCHRLTKSSDAAIAHNASTMEESLSHYKQQMEEYSKLKQQREDEVRVVTQASEKEEDSGERTSGPVLRKHPVVASEHMSENAVLNYFEGTLTESTCMAKKGTFVVVSRNSKLTLNSPDIDDISFSGSQSFHCSLHGVKVKGFYSKKGDTNQLTALEIQ